MILFVSNRQCFFYLFITNFIVWFFVCFEETFVPYRQCKGMGEMGNR